MIMGKRSKSKATKEFEFPGIPGWVPYKSTGKVAAAPQDKDKETGEDTRVEAPSSWKEPRFEEKDNPHGRLYARSSFSTRYPAYRDQYLKEVWPVIKNELMNHYIKVELDSAEGTIAVHTTRRTYDPFIILKARDVIRLLARSVPAEQALRVLADDVFADVINIGLPKKERCLRRSQRLVGPDGATLKTIEIVTGCSITVQGKTVAVIGPWDRLKEVRQIVTDCIDRNIHPIYNIKRLMIVRTLANNPRLANESWDRFLPKIKKKTLNRHRKPHKIRQKKEYTPFPPPQQPRQVDIELERGTYFIESSKKHQITVDEKIKRSVKNSLKKQAERNKAFQPPPAKKRKVEKQESGGQKGGSD